MTFPLRYILPVLLALYPLILFGQNSEENHDHLYGYDPLLFNGKVYTFLPGPGTEGTQFLFDQFDAHGSATLRGVVYPDVSINYDVYNQQLVLKYNNAVGSESRIELSKAWLEAFEIKQLHFEILNAADTTKRIFQVLGTGPSRIAYFRWKNLLLDTRTSSRNHFFTDPILERYLVFGDKMVKYKNNRTFIAAFGTANQDLIKKYLRKQNINVKKATDLQMTGLINYCNTLAGS
jgi:hypothetical protein